MRLAQTQNKGNFVAEGAVFVCNKWDLIEQDPEKERIADHIIGKLQLYWPGLDCQSQVVKLSTIKAIELQNFGIILPEFRMFIDSVYSMMFRAIKARLEKECR